MRGSKIIMDVGNNLYEQVHVVPGTVLACAQIAVDPGQHLVFHVFEQIILAPVVFIEGGPVDLSVVTDFPDGNFMDALLRHQPDKALTEQPL